LKVLYTVRSERLLMEQRDHNFLFRSINRPPTPAPVAALAMVAELAGWGRVTLGADKGCGQQEFVRGLREHQVTPHVARKVQSAIDRRTTRHPGYAISQTKRKRVEEIFGWLKTIGGLRKTRHRGSARVGWVLTFAAAALQPGQNAQPAAGRHLYHSTHRAPIPAPCISPASSPDHSRIPFPNREMRDYSAFFRNLLHWRMMALFNVAPPNSVRERIANSRASWS
jgi:hypothetical protein